MPIIVSRTGSERYFEPVLTPEQRKKLWEAYVNAYIDRHPELFEREVTNENL